MHVCTATHLHTAVLRAPWLSRTTEKDQQRAQVRPCHRTIGMRLSLESWPPEPVMESPWTVLGRGAPGPTEHRLWPQLHEGETPTHTEFRPVRARQKSPCAPSFCLCSRERSRSCQQRACADDSSNGREIRRDSDTQPHFHPHPSASPTGALPYTRMHARTGPECSE